MISYSIVGRTVWKLGHMANLFEELRAERI